MLVTNRNDGQSMKITNEHKIGYNRNVCGIEMIVRIAAGVAFLVVFLLVSQLVNQFCSCVHVTLNASFAVHQCSCSMQFVGLCAVFGTSPQCETVQQSAGQRWIASTTAHD